jgi:hypothetical protein
MSWGRRGGATLVASQFPAEGDRITRYARHADLAAADQGEGDEVMYRRFPQRRKGGLCTSRPD